MDRQTIDNTVHVSTVLSMDRLTVTRCAHARLRLITLPRSEICFRFPETHNIPNLFKMASNDVHPLENADLSKLPDDLKEKLDMARVESILMEAAALSILMTGRTGTGKSTLINGLLGMTVEDDDWAHESSILGGPGQLRLQAHNKKKGRYEVTVYDSRGLLDGTNPRDQAKNLDEMVNECSGVDLKLLCIDMSQRKFILDADDNSDIKAMKKLTEAFGEKFWENLMVVLTFANKIKLRKEPTEQHQAENFVKRLKEWEEHIHCAITLAGAPKEMAERVKIVPAGRYDNRKLPDREYWLSDLWFECLDAMPSPGAQGAFLSINLHRIRPFEEITEEEWSQSLKDQPCNCYSIIRKKGKGKRYCTCYWFCCWRCYYWCFYCDVYLGWWANCCCCRSACRSYIRLFSWIGTWNEKGF